MSQLNKVLIENPATSEYDTIDIGAKGENVEIGYDANGKIIITTETEEPVAVKKLTEVLSDIPKSTILITQEDYDKLEDKKGEYLIVDSDTSVEASIIDYDNSSSGIDATNVQEAIDKLAEGGGGEGSGVIKVTYDDFIAHEEEYRSSGKTYFVTGSEGGILNAKGMVYDNSISGLDASNVQDAIDEIDSDVNELNKNLNAIPARNSNSISTIPTPIKEEDFFVQSGDSTFPYAWGYLSIRYGSNKDEYFAIYHTTGIDKNMYYNTYRDGAWEGWFKIARDNSKADKYTSSVTDLNTLLGKGIFQGQCAASSNAHCPTTDSTTYSVLSISFDSTHCMQMALLYHGYGTQKAYVRQYLNTWSSWVQV